MSEEKFNFEQAEEEFEGTPVFLELDPREVKVVWNARVHAGEAFLDTEHLPECECGDKHNVEKILVFDLIKTESSVTEPDESEVMRIMVPALSPLGVAILNGTLTSLANAYLEDLDE